MNQEEKNQLYKTAQTHINDIQSEINKELMATEIKLGKGKSDYKSLSRADQTVQQILTGYNQKRIEELNLLYPTPYFNRTDIVLKNGEQKIIYIAKFPFSEQSIYSWVAPIAALRFEKPGPISYTKPDTSVQSGTLTRKDQYMIIDGHITFFATESAMNGRELVYQEHFSNRKTSFTLPEIVEQMEKAQDKVIRADHRGPLIISGPAGSGKTTLALHRVAYLLQAPETSEFFRSNRTIVFVQDIGTQTYFTHLLPELGITDVIITTFSAWAKNILEFPYTMTTGRYGQTEYDKDRYEWQKLQALRNEPLPRYTKHSFSLLKKLYASHLSPDMMNLFSAQEKEKMIDRIDATILLKSYAQTRGQLETNQTYYVQQKNGAVIKKQKRFPLGYTLLVMDEFQNYLPEQLKLIKDCMESNQTASVYVGDLAQQVHLGTVHTFTNIAEMIPQNRKVILQKIYRNTKNILMYIQSLGYTLTIPHGIKTGPNVVEKKMVSTQAEIAYIESLLKIEGVGSIGVLGKDNAYLLPFKTHFKDSAQIHLLTFIESQGVEFDTVCLVGLDTDLFILTPNMDQDFYEQKQRIQKDLLYVALTRAMRELHVLGRVILSEILPDPSW